MAYYISGIDLKSRKPIADQDISFYREKAKLEYKNGITKITVPGFIPHVNRSINYGKYRDLWYFILVYLISKSGSCIKRYSKAFIWFEVHSNAPWVWDVDNIAFSTFINALKLSGILLEDSYDKMSFGVEGISDNENYVVVYITEKNPHVEKIKECFREMD